ncbi:hypothetical protein Pst134EB_027548 [Puccinia striiformis f. sp. tritici]|nr:hypothetical protein Pst134EB_027548 [Puccinia striiformis f. sp. tritici]
MQQALFGIQSNSILLLTSKTRIKISSLLRIRASKLPAPETLAETYLNQLSSVYQDIRSFTFEQNLVDL